MTNNEFHPPPPPAIGDSDASSVYRAVGEALSGWEYVEGVFAEIYGQLIRPGRTSYASLRAFGSLESARSRRGLITQASAVFFTFFPNKVLQPRLKSLLGTYQEASARRNEIAHGQVFNEVNGIAGYVLTANTWGSKGRAAKKIKAQYAYSSDQIDTLRLKFFDLANDASSLCVEIETHFASSPSKRRELY